MTDDTDSDWQTSKKLKVDYSRAVFANVITLTAMLQPIGHAHLVAIAAQLTPGTSSDAVRRAIEHLKLESMLQVTQRTGKHRNSSLRQVVTTGYGWGRHPWFDTYGVALGPDLADIPIDVLDGHLLVAHHLAVALLSDQQILADTAWIDDARQSATHRPSAVMRSAASSADDGSVTAIPEHTCIGVITPSARELLFGGFWTRRMEYATMLRIVRAGTPVHLIHPGTRDCAWIVKAGEYVNTTLADTHAVTLRELSGRAVLGRAIQHDQSLTACRTRWPQDAALRERNVNTLLNWRRGTSTGDTRHR